MLRHRRAARAADLVHYQWLSVQQLDARMLPPNRPRVITAHDVIPREPKPGRSRARSRSMNAWTRSSCTPRTARGPLTGELGLDPDLVHVIPHGVFDYLTRQETETPLPDELAAVEKPVVLWFGLIRPYKGPRCAAQAWRGIEDAELWVVGMPRMPLAPLREPRPPNVRFVPRFVTDPEMPAYFRRADLAVAAVSGDRPVGRPFSAPGVRATAGPVRGRGFPEVAATGAAELVPPGDSGALHDA